MLTPTIWPELDELSRIRIENKLISGIRSGELGADGRVIQSLATWSRDFLKAFTLKIDAALALIERLESNDDGARRYVATYFMRNLPEVMSSDSQMRRCIGSVVFAIRNGDDNVQKALIDSIRHYPVDWQEKLAVALQDKTDADNPAVRLHDGRPFLASPSIDNLDDEVLF